MITDNDILEELKTLSPTLFKLKEKGSHPFRVPAGYFATMKSDVFTYIDSGLAEELGKSTKPSFQVPENYFEELSGDVMRKIEAIEVVEGGKVIDLQESRMREPIPIRRWTLMAASVALFILLGVFAARFISIGGIDPMDMTAFNEITNEEALEYLGNNSDALDDEDLLALVSLDNQGFTLDIADELEDELNQYLEENIDDLEDYLLTVEI